MVFGDRNYNSGNNNNKNSPFYFIDYDKIADVVMRFDSSYYLKFNVRLSRTDKDGNRIPFHSEYKSRPNGNEMYSIRREYTTFYSIESYNRDIDRNYVYMYPGDIYVLNMLINNNILPWFVGEKRIFGKNSDDQLCIKYNDFEKQYLPLSAGQFLSFLPAIIQFPEGSSKEGVTIGINRESVSFDITVDRFFQFAYIIQNTDMLSMAASMINYVKIKPYLLNYKDLT